MLIFYSTIVVFVLMCSLWFIFIRPLFKYQKFASRKIREITFSKLIDIDKNILAISSAAIIFTVSLLNKGLLSNSYLIGSWACFIVSIISGIMLYVANITHDYTDEISVHNTMSLLNKEKGKASNEEVHDVRTIISNQRTLLKIIFILIYIEMSSLILAFILLSIFGYKNLFALPHCLAIS